MKPLIRVFHVSDIHFAPKDSRAAHFRRVVNATLGRVSAPLAVKTLQGVSPHDNTAVRELEDSIIAAANDGWTGETRLVCTGDLTTWGDNASLRGSQQMLRRIARKAGLGKPTVLYGNHDVWPREPWSLWGFPLFARVCLDSVRSDLRNNWFKGTWPLSAKNDQTFFVATVPGKRLAFCSLNTIVHDRFDNMLALGEVKQDRYWESNPTPTRQHDDLIHLHMGAGDIGVVFTHHPVHDPASLPRSRFRSAPGLPVTRVLRNASVVATTLARPITHLHAVHVFVSGHVHQIIPDVGKLAAGAQPPLQATQLQLCVGTAAQQSPPKVPVRQSWQELRFYLDADELMVERVVHLRHAQTSGFYPVCAEGDPRAIAEQVRLPLSRTLSGPAARSRHP